MTIRDVALRHIERTFERESWQPSLAQAVAGLTAAQAAWKPAPDRHSIWQIVRHLTHWKRPVLDGWGGGSPDYERVEATDWQDASGDDAAWEADVRALHDVSAEVAARVRGWSVEELLRAPEGGRRPRLHTVMDMATHDAYHAGQIRYLRAMQGA